jgi:hypothetical protein
VDALDSQCSRIGANKSKLHWALILMAAFQMLNNRTSEKFLAVKFGKHVQFSNVYSDSISATSHHLSMSEIVVL